MLIIYEDAFSCDLPQNPEFWGLVSEEPKNKNSHLHHFLRFGRDLKKPKYLKNYQGLALEMFQQRLPKLYYLQFQKLISRKVLAVGAQFGIPTSPKFRLIIKT